MLRKRPILKQRTASLSVQISIAIIIMTTLVLGLFGGYQYKTLSTQEEKALHLRAERIAARLQKNLTSPLFNCEEHAAKEILLSEIISRDIAGITITQKNETEFGVLRTKSDEILETTGPMQFPDKDHFHIPLTVNKRNIELGTVTLFITLQHLHQTRRQTLWMLIAQIVILDMLLMTMLLVIFRRLIFNPLRMAIQIVTQVAQGEMPLLSLNKKQTGLQQALEHPGEIGELLRVANTLQGTTQQILNETQTVIQAIQRGELSCRGRADEFQGNWRDLVLGLNNVIEAFLTPFTVTSVCLKNIAEGNIPKQITDDLEGDFNEIKDYLNTLSDTLRFVLEETSALSCAVQEGNLAYRGHAERFVGDWRHLIDGMNSVIETFLQSFGITRETIERIAVGDVPEQLNLDYRGDFRAIQLHLNHLISAMNEITELASKMASGDLHGSVTERSERDKLMQALNSMLKRLDSVLITAAEAAKNVNDGSQAVSAGAEQLSKGANAQAAAAEEVSSSMEEMVANIRQSAGNAEKTETLALKAAGDAQTGGEVVMRTVAAMRKIVSKISMIAEIARQTHMLSLNATIEAARAEDYGKGFGVVASEVRALAERVHSATSEINDITAESISVAEEAAELLGQVVPGIRQTAELVQEISASNKEQQLGAEQINLASQQLTRIIQQNSVSSEEMAAIAVELAIHAKTLEETVAFFNTTTKQVTNSPTTSQEAKEPLWENITSKQRGVTGDSLRQTSDRQGTDTRGNGQEAGVNLFMFDGEHEALRDELDSKFQRF